MTMTLEEHNAKVAALKAEYDAKRALYNQLKDALNQNEIENTAECDAAFWEQTEAFKSYMDAADERYDATVAHYADTKADA